VYHESDKHPPTGSSTIEDALMTSLWLNARGRGKKEVGTLYYLGGIQEEKKKVQGKEVTGGYYRPLFLPAWKKGPRTSL